MKGNDGRFEATVAKHLRAVPGISFTQGATLPGLVADFLVTTPKGRIVIEAKAGVRGGRELARVAGAVDRQRSLLGRKAVFAVVEGLATSRHNKGLIAPADVTPWLRQIAARRRPARRGRLKKAAMKAAKAPRGQLEARARPIVFVAMPFEPRYDDTFQVAMRSAAKAVGAACDRVDTIPFNDDIVRRIQQGIRGATVVIADLSEAKPNVLYEAGYAHARGKQTIHVSSTPLARLPFDVRNWNTLPYTLGQTNQLRRALTPLLRDALKRTRRP